MYKTLMCNSGLRDHPAAAESNDAMGAGGGAPGGGARMGCSELVKKCFLRLPGTLHLSTAVLCVHVCQGKRLRAPGTQKQQ